MRYFISMAFNGSAFFGWQIQPRQISVQEVLQKGMSQLLQEKITITGCGRTDTGVHARQFYAHFDSEKLPDDTACQQLTYRLNRILPPTIAIFSIFKVDLRQHARFDAIDRTYRYYINLKKDPFTSPFAMPIYTPLHIEKMNEAASYLTETTDFTSFSKLHTQTKNNLCQVKTAVWTEVNNQLVFEITADRFLRNMVRAIVGTLLYMGKEKISMDEFKHIVNQKDRCKAGESVPAQALFLENIRYSFINL